MNKNSGLNKIYKSLHHILFVAVITCGAIPPSASAENGNVPPELQAKLFLTALTYDKNLEKRVHAHVDIGIVYFPESPQSKEEALNFSKTLEGFKDKKVDKLLAGIEASTPDPVPTSRQEVGARPRAIASRAMRVVG